MKLRIKGVLYKNSGSNACFAKTPDGRRALKKLWTEGVL
jgi:hypothetical protein